MTKTSIACVFVTFSLVMLLFVIGIDFKKKTMYTDMETNLSTKADKYIEKHKVSFKKDKTLILNSSNIGVKLEKGCKGYVVVKNTNKGYKYNPYIKCKKYTTEGFDKKNL